MRNKPVIDKTIRQFSEQLVELMETKTIDELKEIISECEQLTRTNCWWVEYQMKDLLLQVASNQIKLLNDRPQDPHPRAATNCPDGM